MVVTIPLIIIIIINIIHIIVVIIIIIVIMVLTERQQKDLHAGIYEYLLSQEIGRASCRERVYCVV